MDLAGIWRAVEADEDLRRRYPDPDFDDSGWEQVVVPGHWRSVPAFVASDGPLLYRSRFEAPAPAEGRRSWLTFDGLYYQGDIWLDGSYLGDTEGSFFPHTFEVTDALRDRAEHVLALELSSPRLDPDGNPGGVWRPVRVTESGPVRIVALRALCAEATPERAVVRFRAVLDAAGTCTVRLRTTIGETDHEVEQPLSEGENRVLWEVVVDRPQLWWPHVLGEQPLHDAAVEVALGSEGTVSDRRRFRTGLRQVRMRNWTWTVNGERLFLKGSTQGPARSTPAETRPEDFERDVELAVDAGLDLLRVHGHVSRPELYDAADRRGLLLWQDLPLPRGYARGVRKQAGRQARAAVDLLGHHPSVVLWCGAGAFGKADGTRPTVSRAPASLPSGWRSRDERDLAHVLALWPRLGRFVTGFDALEHIEHLRRLKYRPAGGFCHCCFADSAPGTTGAVLDHERAPKQAYEALAAACAPVIVTADRPPAECRPGDALALDVHVVSDRRTPVHGVRVAAVLRWEGGTASWSWEGDLSADSCERVGMVRAVVPDAPGPLVLDLDLDGPDVKAANRYQSLIVPAP
jgi:beta-galactosidase/beta-glucuronidase